MLTANSFCHYYIHSFLRTSVLRHRYNDTKAKISLPILQELFLGFIAGVASRAVSMLLNLITLCLQAERDDNDENPDQDKAVGLSSVVNLVYSERGLFGFWRGFQTTIMLSLNPSITLAVFQIYKRVADRLSPSRFSTIKPSPEESFIGGAVSSSIGVLYS